jgi:hypothetical protein
MKNKIILEVEISDLQVKNLIHQKLNINIKKHGLITKSLMSYLYSFINKKCKIWKI